MESASSIKKRHTVQQAEELYDKMIARASAISKRQRDYSRCMIKNGLGRILE
ncbi:hypothetical protein BFJ63_vAg861 [Fusarium oxysporum f. sp. narcissi]|uniref:Uncharacterized protein n=1 Tax=Fusarium oxysporum f. sp. narcissi TaxID=451672 RepID=A0A4Q2WDI2_FUSOX|nr:hypothetical protein BFJ63_vAg861 [Fusarium oxysporum f. sp. narcissi]